MKPIGKDREGNDLFPGDTEYIVLSVIADNNASIA